MNRLLLECAAAQILIDFTGALEPAVMSHTFRGWTCTVVIAPAEGSIPILKPEQLPTQCEADILTTLRDAGRRMLRPEIINALEDRHGESTLEKALARLVKAGKIDRVTRRGYAIRSDK